jgi:hypothetical protein
MPRRDKSDHGYIAEVDLSFIPEKYKQRVAEIYDQYFNLALPYEMHQNIEGYKTPNMPESLASLTSQSLGDLHGLYSAWYSFLSGRKKYLLLVKNAVERDRELAYSRTLAGLATAKGNIDTRRAAARTDDEVVMLDSYCEKIDGMCSMLDIDLSNYEKQIAVLSREMSRRSSNAGF